ncbi:MAG: hypothetical protein IJ659_02585 [Alloprevotella sp.]|nr:hypothetical protein [Alloprevotella sp.]
MYDFSDLTFRVADFCFRLCFPEGTDGRRLLPSYAPFHVPGGADGLIFTLRVTEGGVSLLPEGEEIGQFDAGGNNHGVYRLTDGGYKIVISNPAGEEACAMRTNEAFTRCEVTLYGDEDNRRFGLNNAVMITYAFSGARHGLLLMHASVTMNSGRAFLFLGKSGTGKSTHSDLWVKHVAGSEILNDDNPAVFRRPDGSICVAGTPWSGKRNFYRQLILPAGAFVRLEQAPENVLRREPKLQAFASILSSCSTMIWDKPSYDAICDTVGQVASSVPVYHLRNLPNEEAARMSAEACLGNA